MITKSTLQHLYSAKQMSMNEISHFLNCSIHTVVYWMKFYNISRRSRSDAAYIKANPNGNPFMIKKNLTQTEIFLFGLGIGIYWGEGTKVAPHSVRVANSDPAILRTFIRFLKIICQIKPDRLHFSIVAFQNSDISIVKDYWSKQLEIPDTSFGTIVRIPPQGRGTYKKKSVHGVCTVTFSNIKLKKWVMDQIHNIEGARVV